MSQHGSGQAGTAPPLPATDLPAPAGPRRRTGGGATLFILIMLYTLALALSVALVMNEKYTQLGVIGTLLVLTLAPVAGGRHLEALRLKLDQLAKGRTNEIQPGRLVDLMRKVSDVQAVCSLTTDTRD